MTVFALNGGVRAQQREAILVIFYLLDGDVPALNSVALRAVRAHFSLVNVTVAVLAVFANVCEYRLDVTLHALHFFVHAAKRILGLVVIELRHSADGAPTRGVVAVLTGNRKRSVRTSSGLTLRGMCLRGSWQPGKKQEPAKYLSALARSCPQTAGSLDPSSLAEGCSTNNQVNMVTLAKAPNNCTHGQIKARHSGVNQ